MKKTHRTRTITAGGTMLAAAFIAFSLNQTGLTGRATGGAVGCGGIEAIGDEPFVAQRGDVEAEPVQVLDLIPILSLDGRHVELTSRRQVPPMTASLDDRSTAVLTPEEFVRLRKPRPDNLSGLIANEKLRTFNALVDASGMRDLFDDTSAEFTVFAPTDEAFEAWPRLDELLERDGDAFVRAFVAHHMIAGASRVDELPAEVVDSMAPGQQLRIDRSRRIVHASGGSQAQLVEEGIEGERSMAHMIDGVLIPVMTSVQELELRQDYSMFLTMLDVAGELERIGRPDRGSTVLAISDMVLQELGFIPSDLRSPGMEGQIRTLVRNHVMDGMHPEFREGEESVKTDSGLYVQNAEEGFIVMSNGDQLRAENVGTTPNGVLWDVRGLIDYAP